MIQVYRNRWTSSYSIIVKNNKTIIGAGHDNNIIFYSNGKGSAWFHNDISYKLIGTYKSFREYIAENFAELV